MRAVSDPGPVGDSRLPDLAALGRGPPLPPQKRSQRLRPEDDARADVHDWFPVDAGQERWAGLDRRCGPGGSRTDLLDQLQRRAAQNEPVRRVGAEREEVRLLAYPRELGETPHLDRYESGKLPQ